MTEMDSWRGDERAAQAGGSTRVKKYGPSSLLRAYVRTRRQSIPVNGTNANTFGRAERTGPRFSWQQIESTSAVRRKYRAASADKLPKAAEIDRQSKTQVKLKRQTTKQFG